MQSHEEASLSSNVSLKLDSWDFWRNIIKKHATLDFDRLKTTNYCSTFIEVADDCPVKMAKVPPQKGGKDTKTVAALQFEMIKDNPYRHTSDDVLFRVYAIRNRTSGKNVQKERERFFSKGQPCFRSSPLVKRYGWGVHSDSKGRIALYAVESSEYEKLSKDKNLKHLKAMRSKSK